MIDRAITGQFQKQIRSIAVPWKPNIIVIVRGASARTTSQRLFQER